MIFLLALWFTGNLFEWVGKGFMLNLLMCLFLFVGLGKAMSTSRTDPRRQFRR